MPSEVWMLGAEKTLCEDEVEDEEEDACGGENLGGDGEADVGLLSGPCDAHGEGDDADEA